MPLKMASNIQRTLSINKAQLASIMHVLRSEVYSWLEGKTPGIESIGRLEDLCRLIGAAKINQPLNARFVRHSIAENQPSIVEVLKAKVWDEELILELLIKARDLSLEDQLFHQRLTEIHEKYGKPSEEEQDSILAHNIIAMNRKY